EEDKNALEIFRRDADAVVPDGEEPLGPFALDSDLNFGRFRASEFDGVADEILKELGELDGIAIDDRQGIVLDLSAAFGEGKFEVGQGAFEDLVAADGLEGFALRADPGVA